MSCGVIGGSRIREHCSEWEMALLLLWVDWHLYIQHAEMRVIALECGYQLEGLLRSRQFGSLIAKGLVRAAQAHRTATTSKQESLLITRESPEFLPKIQVTVSPKIEEARLIVCSWNIYCMVTHAQATTSCKPTKDIVFLCWTTHSASTAQTKRNVPDRILSAFHSDSSQID